MFQKCIYGLFHNILIEVYITLSRLDIKKEAKIWVIQKNTEAEEKLAQKREEQEKEIKENNLIIKI
tara:strand:- start:800 stop:997 length:198 start_codon:yes stop_codon:yes gene_type:complete